MAKTPPAGRPMAPGASPATAPAAAPWRRIALCIKASQLYLGGVLQKIHGGTWLTDQAHVNIAASDVEHFALCDVTSPEHQGEILAKHAADVAALRESAAKLGMALVAEGSFTLNKR